MDFSSSIKIGPHVVSQIEYDQIEPGDFICTYEALATRADLLFLKSVQKQASFSHRPELNKMFHTAVILKKYPRIGVYKIAHADGSNKKIVIQDDNFKEHHPGQAFVVFRSKDKDIKKEIIDVANVTAKSDNGHICKTLLFENFLHRMRYIVEFFLFENLEKRSTGKALRNLASMIANYDKLGTLYSKEGTGRKEMSCVEYTVNVVNVAISRVLIQKTLNENEIYHQLKKKNKNEILPFKLSHPDVTPASFVDFFLKSNKYFETVGYLGKISEPLEGPLLDIKGTAIQILPSILSELLYKDKFSKPPLDAIYAAKVMKALGILNDSWQIYSKAAKDPVKIKAFFAITHYAMHKRPFQVTSFSKNLETLSATFLQSINEYTKKNEHPKQENLSFPIPKLDSLDHQEIIKILNVEKDFLKSASLERSEKTLKLSLNFLEIKMVVINRIKLIANKLFNIGKAMRKTVVFSLFYFIFFKAGSVLNFIAFRREKICRKKVNDLLTLHEKVRKNGKFTLDSDAIPEGHRPWIHFSLDNGITWNLEYFKIKDGLWNTVFHIPKNIDVKYRLFIGPEDTNDPDPFNKALAMQTDVTLIPKEKIQAKQENDSECLIIPHCTKPNWLFNKPKRTEQFFAYQKQCNEQGPSEHLPDSIQDYDAIYNGIEASMAPQNTTILNDEKEIISHLQTFIKTEMGVTTLPEQIQLMTGGLGKGLSGDQLYKVLDENNHPLFAIKVFLKSRGRFTREFFSLINHENLNLNSLDLPKITGIGALQTKQKKLFFLAMNYIPGTTLYDIFMDLVKYNVDSIDRKKILKKLIHIYKKLGQGMAEFHLTGKENPLPVHSVFADMLQAFCKNTFKKFEGHLDPLFLTKLRNFFHKQIPIEFKKAFFRGYHHGDINAGNIIYDSVSDRLSVVDWPDGSFSVGKNGKSLGIPFYDVIQIKNELLNRRVQGVTEEEVSQLCTAFDAEYFNSGLSIPAIETMNFFSSIDLMGSLKWFIDKQEMFKSSDLETAKKIYQIKLEKLETLIT